MDLKGLGARTGAKVGWKWGPGLGLGKQRRGQAQRRVSLGKSIQPEAPRRDALHTPQPAPHRSQSGPGPGSHFTRLSETVWTRVQIPDPDSSSTRELQFPTPPISEPESPIPSPGPWTWLPSSDPNLDSRYAPASSLLGGAQSPPAGQSRGQQVQGEGAASEDQKEPEQRAHVGSAPRPAGQPRGSLARRGAAPGGLRQRSTFADGPGRGPRQDPPPNQAPPPEPGPSPRF